jgi:hypothetical protein
MSEERPIDESLKKVASERLGALVTKKMKEDFQDHPERSCLNYDESLIAAEAPPPEEKTWSDNHDIPPEHDSPDLPSSGFTPLNLSTEHQVDAAVDTISSSSDPATCLPFDGRQNEPPTWTLPATEEQIWEIGMKVRNIAASSPVEDEPVMGKQEALAILPPGGPNIQNQGDSMEPLIADDPDKIVTFADLRKDLSAAIKVATAIVDGEYESEEPSFLDSFLSSDSSVDVALLKAHQKREMASTVSDLAFEHSQQLSAAKSYNKQKKVAGQGERLKAINDAYATSAAQRRADAEAAKNATKESRRLEREKQVFVDKANKLAAKFNRLAATLNLTSKDIPSAIAELKARLPKAVDNVTLTTWKSAIVSLGGDITDVQHIQPVGIYGAQSKVVDRAEGK